MLSQLEGLRHPSKRKAVPNEAEELFILAWEVVKSEVDRLREKGWALDKRGRGEEAGLYYQGVNIFFYLVNYGIIIRSKLDREGELGLCLDFKEMSIDCVVANLPCLSKKYCTDYVSAWSRLTEVFGIDTQDKCDECCIGVGSSIIEGDDDCTSLIIGDCGDQSIEESGEFAPCEFVINEFTQPVGDVYTNCN